MLFSPGTKIACRLLPELAQFNATVVSVEGDTVILSLPGEIPDRISKGKSLELSVDDSVFLAEVADVRGDAVRVRMTWTQQREYFRVDDVFFVTVKKVEDSSRQAISKIFSGHTLVKNEEDVPENAINPVVWKMLGEINMKLELIMEKLDIGRESADIDKNKHVNISASGIRLTTNEKIDIGDMIEVKMFLATMPSIGIITCGKAVRVSQTADGRFDVALHFSCMSDDVRDEIIQYTLMRHREIIRQQRQSGKVDQ